MYRYLVTYTPSQQANISGFPFHARFSFHMLDSLAFFGGLKDSLGVLAPSDIAFQEVVTQYFLHFAREGKQDGTVKYVSVMSWFNVSLTFRMSYYLLTELFFN